MGTRRNKTIESQNRTGLSAPLKNERFWLKIHRDDAWRAQGRKCKYCHEPLRKDQATADLRTARKNGGTTSTVNILVACGDCNVAKGARTELSFKRAIRDPAPTDTWGIWMAWSRRRLWLRAEAANTRLLRYVGMDD